MFRPEILAPAGNLFKLKTAVRYGADAVYIAGRRFGLRSAAENFTVQEIFEGCAFAHQHGVKVYIVLNGFLFDEELEELPAFLRDVEGAGLDAAIVSDLGVVEMVRTHSKIPIHLSTQASALNTQAALFWKSRGVTRLVLGREATIEQAAAIKRQAGVEVELFAHGAMCMAYSGNCTISNYTAGRDSNRGGCIQSCRFKYSYDQHSGNFLSSKDLEGIRQMPQFIEREIDSLKIEGRMKSPLYVATTVRAYAAARDELLQGLPPDFAALRDELNTMSHRDYTTGNLEGPAGSQSIYYSNDIRNNTHDMLGHILERKPGSYIAVWLKNPLETGNAIQLLIPNGQTLSITVNAIRTPDGEALERANPNRVVLLEDHPLAEKDLLLRKPKNDCVNRNPAQISA